MKNHKKHIPLIILGFVFGLLISVFYDWVNVNYHFNYTNGRFVEASQSVFDETATSFYTDSSGYHRIKLKFLSNQTLCWNLYNGVWFYGTFPESDNHLRIFGHNMDLDETNVSLFDELPSEMTLPTDGCHDYTTNQIVDFYIGTYPAYSGTLGVRENYDSDLFGTYSSGATKWQTLDSNDWATFASTLGGGWSGEMGIYWGDEPYTGTTTTTTTTITTRPGSAITVTDPSDDETIVQINSSSNVEVPITGTFTNPNNWDRLEICLEKHNNGVLDFIGVGVEGLGCVSQNIADQSSGTIVVDWPIVPVYGTDKGITIELNAQFQRYNETTKLFENFDADFTPLEFKTAYSELVSPLDIVPYDDTYTLTIIKPRPDADNGVFGIQATGGFMQFNYNIPRNYIFKVTQATTTIYNDHLLSFDPDRKNTFTISITPPETGIDEVLVQVYDQFSNELTKLSKTYEITSVVTQNGGDYGFIVNLFVDAMNYLFIPSNSAIEHFKELTDTMKTKFPLSLWYDLVNAMPAPTANETLVLPTFTIPHKALGTVADMSMDVLNPPTELKLNSGWIGFRNLIVMAIWSWLILYILGKFAGKEKL